MVTLTFERSMAASGHGNDRDFDELYAEYRSYVSRVLGGMGVPAGDREDLAHETFLVLLRKIDEFSTARSPRSWLWQVARRVASNYRRGHRRRAQAMESLERSRGARPIDEDVRRMEGAGILVGFLAQLDDDARALFLMSELEGFRGPEIADAFEIPVQTAYSRIRRAREAFRVYVEDRRNTRAVPVWFPDAFVAAALRGSIRLPAAGLVVAGLLLVVALALLGFLATHGGSGEPPQLSSPSVPGGDRERRETSARDQDPEEIRRVPANSEYGGIVVQFDGTPIAEAIVCADRGESLDRSLTDPPACVSSDRTGRFRIRGALAQAHTLEAMARGFVPGRFRGRPTEGVRIVLHPGGVELSGTVADVYGGPVEGAWVSVENRSDTTLGATVRTNEAGAFALWVAEGPVSLAAGAERYAASFKLALAPSKDVRIELGAESVLAGIVVDGETGEPVEGVRVAALLVPASETYANRGRVAISDAAGRWEIRGLQPNQYVLDAAGDHGWGRGPGLIDLGIGEHQDEIRIEMMAAVEIAGRIFDADTDEGCVDGYAATDDHAQLLDRVGIVDGDGLVTVAPLTGGAVYEVTVSCRGYAEGKFEVDLREGPVPSQDWPLRRGGEFVVRVVDAGGTPLQDWSVDVSELGHRTTDVEGSAVFAGVTPGIHRVVASGPDHPPVVAENVELSAERSELELRAAAGVPVIGTVTNSDGRPVEGALVALQRLGAEQTERVSEAGPYHAVTNARGEFEHASVVSGEYGVWVLPPDAAVTVQRPGALAPGFAARVAGKPLRTVAVGEREVTLALELTGLRSISGVVRGEDGDVIMDARVFAVREHEGDVRDSRGRPRLTDAEGRYRFDELPPGTYYLTAYRHGGGVARLAGVKAGARGADLEFKKTGSISGTVSSANGSPIEGYALIVNKPGAGAHFDPQVIPVGSKAGRFVATGLDAGRYSLSVRTPDGRGNASVELAAGQHRSGVEIKLDPGEHIVGRLVGGDHKPLVGWFAAGRTPGATADRPTEWVSVAEIGSDGTFAILPPGPGPVAIVALRSSEDLADASPTRVHEIVTGAPELRVITLEDGQTFDLGDVTVLEGQGGGVEPSP